MATPVALTYYEVAVLAHRAGWRGNDAVTAVAIAKAESELNPTATNFKPPDQSYGLWQINMIGRLGPERRAKYKLARNEDLLKPEVNARVAFAIWQDRGRKFTDWSTYVSGRHLPYRGFAEFAVKQAAQGQQFWEPLMGATENPSLWDSLTPDVDNPLDGVGQLAKAVGGVGEFVTNRENWIRVGAAIGGGILVILAVFLLLADTVAGVVVKKVIRSGSRAGKAVGA